MFKYMFEHKSRMAVKTITITESAYESIKKLKRSGESFSDLFLRLFREKRSTGRSMYGLLKGADTDQLLAASRDFRERMTKDREERKRVFARQLGSDRTTHRRQAK